MTTPRLLCVKTVTRSDTLAGISCLSSFLGSLSLAYQLWTISVQSTTLYPAENTPKLQDENEKEQKDPLQLETAAEENPAGAIKRLEEERRRLSDDDAEKEKYALDEASLRRQKALGHRAENPGDSKARMEYDVAKKRRQELADDRNRRQLRLRRVELDIKALRRK